MNNYGLIHKSTGYNNTVNNLSLTSGLDLPDLLTKPLNLEYVIIKLLEGIILWLIGPTIKGGK